MSDALDLVRQWHTALNSGDVETVIALVDPDVEVVGPRGSTNGAQVVREWFARASVRLLPLRFYHRDNTVVAEEQGEWLSPETGEVTSSASVATVFVVEDTLITRIARYEDASTALSAAGLSETDNISID